MLGAFDALSGLEPDSETGVLKRLAALSAYDNNDPPPKAA
jgi:hypothetical protein